MYQYIKGWKELAVWQPPPNFIPATAVSILIPARNEEDNILACLQSILAQNYPSSLFEIIVLDDHSTDDTAKIVVELQNERVKLLHLADFVKASEIQSFKKKAIEIGIAHARGELIITTDADCIVQTNWLNLLVAFHQERGINFIAAPVNFHQERSILERFQSLDFMGMMGIAGGGIQRQFMRMCNGANLAYTKTVFHAVNGFEGIDHLASGDDMLLMQKVAAKYPNEVGYLKNRAATVYTYAKPTLKSFINQRLRWATKSSSYRELLVTFILAMVFFFCCNIVFSLFAALFLGKVGWLILLGSVLVKALMDYRFLGMMSRFFGRQDLMLYFVSAFFLHIGYITIIGFLANLKTEYVWKGRKVK